MTTVRTLPPPPPKKNGNGPAAPSAQADPNRFAVTSGIVSGGEKVLLYGPGGVGKTTLAMLAPGAVILDIEGGSKQMNVQRIAGLTTYQDVRDCLHSQTISQYPTIVIDSATRFEDMTTADVVETIPHENGHRVERIEDYGWGKGLTHIYDKSLLFLADCDALSRRGQNVIIIAHICTDNVPNPTGEDFIRYEPRLLAPKSGKSSVRSRMVEWADHVVFLGFDVATKGGKGQGADTRTIYTRSAPTHIAKSRRASLVLPFTGADDATLWDHILTTNAGGQES